MFKDPLLHKLEILYKASSNPKRWLRRGRYAKFREAIRTGPRIADKKKIAEAGHLVLFALNHPGFPDGTLAAGEEPDFTVDLGPRMIGIEHCRVFVERPGRVSLKGQEAVQDRIVERAHVLYREANRAPVMISCGFDDNTQFRDRDVGLLSHQLASSIPATLATEAEWTLIDGYEFGSGWIPGMMAIQGRAPKPYEPPEGRWEVSQGGSVYSCEPFLQAALDSKEKKPKRYRRCDEFWALLVVEGLAPSSFMSRPDPRHVFRSSFDRVFVYHLFEEVTEVRCARPFAGSA